MLTAAQDTAEHERAELPDSLGNFGEDYSVHLYSDTETDTEEEDEEEARVSRSHGLMIASKSALRSALVQASKDAELVSCTVREHKASLWFSEVKYFLTVVIMSEEVKLHVECFLSSRKICRKSAG